MLTGTFTLSIIKALEKVTQQDIRKTEQKVSLLSLFIKRNDNR